MIEHCLIKDPDKRPSPEDLLSEPFMRSARATSVDLEGWACQVREKLTGKPHQRSKSSASVATPSQQAPPRRMSRIDGPAPPPPRRPATTVDAAGGPKERQHQTQPFPTRTSSHAPPRHPAIEGHERSGSAASSSSAAEQTRMMPPPPPKGARPSVQKAYTESSSTVSQREREKLERERESELHRLHAYKQGTIGIGFEGGGSGDSSLEKENEGEGRMPEMKERRRLPPIVAMSNKSNGGLGMKNNGWDG